MTDASTPSARPVSVFAVAAIFLLMALYGLIAMRVYLPHRAPAPQNESPENLSKDLAWRATPEDRRAYLADLRKRQGDQGRAYGWVDKKAGAVQLPIERAMELVVKESGGDK
jgi:hypothetical protein